MNKFILENSSYGFPPTLYKIYADGNLRGETYSKYQAKEIEKEYKKKGYETSIKTK